MDIKKVLYISQEMSPYLSDSPMALFGRQISQGMQEKGPEVRAFMPKYGAINERRNQLHEVIRLSGMNISIDDTDHPLIIKVATLQPTRLQVYFIDNDDYFTRSTRGVLETVSDEENNDERAIFYARGTAETVKKLRWDTSIVHVTGWLSAFAPLYIKTQYADDPSFVGAKVVFSLFNNPFEGTLKEEIIEKLRMDGFTDEHLSSLLQGDIDWIKLNKLAIDHSDAVIESSAGLPAELVEYAKACGKPFLPFTGEDNHVDACYEFYKTL